MVPFSDRRRSGGAATRNFSQFVRYGSNGPSDPSLKVRRTYRTGELKGEEYPGGKIEVRHFLNEKGLFEELPREASGIEIISSYDAKRDMNVDTHVRLPYLDSSGSIIWKEFSVEELVRSQMLACFKRFKQGERGENIGFVSYPSPERIMPYLEFMKTYIEPPIKGSKEEKSHNIRQARNKIRRIIDNGFKNKRLEDKL